MPTLASVQASVDAVLATLQPQLDAQQNPFRNRFGKFFQGIITTRFGNIPNNTDAGALQTMVPTLTGRPTDQAQSWVEFQVPIPSPLPCALTIHVYGSRGRQGHETQMWIRHGGNLYVRTHNIGGEVRRERTWTLFTTPSP